MCEWYEELKSQEEGTTWRLLKERLIQETGEEWTHAQVTTRMWRLRTSSLSHLARSPLASRALPSQESQLTCFACARSQPEEGRGEPHCERSDRLLEVQGHAEGGTEDDQDQQRPCRQEDGVRKAVRPCACSS